MEWILGDVRSSPDLSVDLVVVVCVSVRTSNVFFDSRFLVHPNGICAQDPAKKRSKNVIAGGLERGSTQKVIDLSDRECPVHASSIDLAGGVTCPTGSF